MNKATAIVFPAERQVRLETYELPVLRPDEIRVRTEYSGVSQGTEIWALTGRRRELAFPTVPGYQSIGIVEEMGADAQGYRIGQRVLFASSRLPETFTPTWMGAHVSHALTPASGARAPIPVPDDCDPIAAALAALPAVSLRGMNMLRIQSGDLVVVTGQGLIGQGSAQLARSRGATVITTDVSETRLRLSRENSADQVVNVREQDLPTVVHSLKPGGADIVIETTGRADQFAPCIDLLRPLGQLLLQGWYPDPICFDFHTTHLKRPTIAITCGFDSDETATVLDLMRREELRFRPLVTDLTSVTAAPRLYELMLAADPDVLGAVFDWSVLQ